MQASWEAGAAVRHKCVQAGRNGAVLPQECMWAGKRALLLGASAGEWGRGCFGPECMLWNMRSLGSHTL